MTGTPGSGRYSKVIRGLQEALLALESVANRFLSEKDEEIARLNGEIERLRAALETIAGSSDRLQALQARAALDNIGAKI